MKIILGILTALAGGFVVTHLIALLLANIVSISIFLLIVSIAVGTTYKK